MLACNRAPCKRWPRGRESGAGKLCRMLTCTLEQTGTRHECGLAAKSRPGLLQGMVARLVKELEWLARLLGRARKAMRPACLLGHEAGGVVGYVCRGIQKGV